ncbi:MAG TPA: hydrogenase expression/formation protein HypE [Candidatus Acidoferrales bacterium]|jgi:hydrogenase expression/formation protein HypE|nr:hydrogenase expression/formation protein HypE [Candidatus Acidoferrales bacterium]
MPRETNVDVALSCPVPIAAKESILLGHGSGGRMSGDLLRNILLPALQNPVLDRLDDQAIVDVGGSRIAFTTDSFVVKPLFFPGGDIGMLAVNGTVNDLAMGGAQPLFLSLALILEEGLPVDTLREVMESIRVAAGLAGVVVVTGDTKVVEKGSGDGLFVNTSGIGLVPPGVRLSADQARPGDCVLLSGTIGDHGITILSQREGLEFESAIASDTAALHTLVASMLGASGEIRCLRDPTRGGVSSSLNEIAARSNVGIELEEMAIPIRDEVKGACEMLGLDPLYVANEGKLLAIAAPAAADAILEAMRAHPLGRDARTIGKVTDAHPATVTIRTRLGTSRIVDLLSGDQLPRIC